jgi:chemotaxis protein histidine kinase CheA
MLQFPYQKGDRVKIVKGVYRVFGKGTVVGPAGKQSARVRVDGDILSERTLRLNSLQAQAEEAKPKQSRAEAKQSPKQSPATPQPKQSPATAQPKMTKTKRKATVEVDSAELESILHALEDLTARLNQLITKDNDECF